MWKITWNVAELSKLFFIFGLDCFKSGSAKQEQYLILSCNKIAHKMSWFQSDTGAWYVRSEVGQNVTCSVELKTPETGAWYVRLGAD